MSDDRSMSADTTVRTAVGTVKLSAETTHALYERIANVEGLSATAGELTYAVAEIPGEERARFCEVLDEWLRTTEPSTFPMYISLELATLQAAVCG